MSFILRKRPIADRAFLTDTDRQDALKRVLHVVQRLRGVPSVDDDLFAAAVTSAALDQAE